MIHLDTAFGEEFWKSPGLTDTESERRGCLGKEVRMPRPHPPEFRERAIELARLKEKPVSQIATDLGDL